MLLALALSPPLLHTHQRRHAPVLSVQDSQPAKAALVSALQLDSTSLPADGSAAIEQLQELVHGADIVDHWLDDCGPGGQWQLLSCDPLRAKLLDLGSPIVDLSQCTVELSGNPSGAFGQQRDLVVTLHVNALGDEPLGAVTMAFSGAAAIDLDGDEEGGADCNVVLFSAEVARMSSGDAAEVEVGQRGLAACEAAVAPKLPPGALRTKLRLVWLDGDLCVVRHAEGTIVLAKLAEPRAEAEKEPTEMWVGSPY